MDINNEKLVEGLKYVREILNTLPVTGIDNCQKVINAIINVNITINALSESKKEGEKA